MKGKGAESGAAQNTKRACITQQIRKPKAAQPSAFGMLRIGTGDLRQISACVTSQGQRKIFGFDHNEEEAQLHGDAGKS